MATPRGFSFVGGEVGDWRILGCDVVIGEPLPTASRLDIVEALIEKPPAGAAWSLRGVTSNERYVTRNERAQLVVKQPALGRAEASHAALIPIGKSSAWWELTQDERRELFEERSKHIAIGLRYLPAVARRLHHCRDLGEPFDFLTWFEYPPEHSEAFEELVRELRRSDEWKYVDREIDIRVVREGR
jgi:chlorite dismutase